MKTVHFFAFYLHNLLKIALFDTWSSMNLKNTKSLQFDGDGWGCSSPLPVFRCSVSLLQMLNQSSSDAQLVFFKFQLPHLWVFTPAFMMIYSYFYDEEADYRLNHHEYGFDFVSDVDCNIFLPRIQNFQAEKIIVSCRENFMLNTRIHFILYENEVYSGKEWSVFS